MYFLALVTLAWSIVSCC